MPSPQYHQRYPSQHYVSSDRRSGDTKPSRTVTSVASSRSDVASGASSKSSRSFGYARDPKTSSSPKHGFSKTHDGGYWGASRPSSVCSNRSDITGATSVTRSSHRRFPRNKTDLNIRDEEVDRIKGFSRKPNGGYWIGREHDDPLKTRPHSARAQRLEPPGDKLLLTPRSAYSRKSDAATTPQQSLAAEPTRPVARTYWGSYYRDPERFVEESPRRTPQFAVPPTSGFTRTPLGGFFRGKTYDAPDLGSIEAHRHFGSLPVSPTREADPAAPGPGYGRTNYGGFICRVKRYGD